MWIQFCFCPGHLDKHRMVSFTAGCVGPGVSLCLEARTLVLVRVSVMWYQVLVFQAWSASIVTNVLWYDTVTACSLWMDMSSTSADTEPSSVTSCWGEHYAQHALFWPSVCMWYVLVWLSSTITKRFNLIKVLDYFLIFFYYLFKYPVAFCTFGASSNLKNSTFVTTMILNTREYTQHKSVWFKGRTLSLWYYGCADLQNSQWNISKPV